MDNVDSRELAGTADIGGSDPPLALPPAEPAAQPAALPAPPSSQPAAQPAAQLAASSAAQPAAPSAAHLAAPPAALHTEVASNAFARLIDAVSSSSSEFGSFSESGSLVQGESSAENESVGFQTPTNSPRSSVFLSVSGDADESWPDGWGIESSVSLAEAEDGIQKGDFQCVGRGKGVLPPNEHRRNA